MAKAPTKVELTEMTPEQALAQREQEISAKLAAMEKAANEKMAQAEKILENAKLAAANIPVATAKTSKTFSQEVNEMAKMTMVKRMEAQFGTEKETKWVKNVVIPFDITGDNSPMIVTVNGIEYAFARGEAYDMPEDLYAIVLRSRYVESPLANKARTGNLVTNL